MSFISKFARAYLVFSSLNALAQISQPLPIGSPLNCVTLPNHEAIQECQILQKAQGEELRKQMKSLPRLNSSEAKSPMNCFKRELTGEQVCAN